MGCFVSDAHVHLAAVLRDYNPHFSLVFIPPKDRDETDTKPWAILDSSPAGAPYVMRYLSDDEMKDTNAILAWIFEGDLSKHRPADVFDKIKAREAADELLKLKEREEHLEDTADFADFLWNRSPKHTIKHDGVTYR